MQPKLAGHPAIFRLFAPAVVDLCSSPHGLRSTIACFQLAINVNVLGGRQHIHPAISCSRLLPEPTLLASQPRTGLEEGKETHQEARIRRADLFRDFSVADMSHPH